MIGSGVIRTVGVTALALGYVLQLGGCGTFGLTSRSELRTMSAERALERMESDVRTAERLDIFIDSALLDAYKQQLSNLESDIDQQIQDADTPEQALAAMVDDFTGYLLTELPKDADARGLDYRISVAMGKLINRDQDPRLEGALGLIRSRLINNERFTSRFDLLATTKDRADEIINDIQGGDMSAFENPGGEPVDFIHKDDIYVVEGRTWIGKGGYKEHKLTVYTEIFAYHPSSNSAFASDVIKKNYYYHIAEEGFISEADNNSRE